MAAVNSSTSSPAKNAGVPAAKYCLCAPTTHPGSFRCRLHRPTAAAKAAVVPPAASEESEMSAVEATTGSSTAAAVRAFLARASRDSKQDGGRIKCFQPRTSRLGIMQE